MELGPNCIVDCHFLEELASISSLRSLEMRCGYDLCIMLDNAVYIHY